MSEKGDHSKTTREERLAANLRANLRRRKQAARKSASTPPHADPVPDPMAGTVKDHSPDKPLP